MWDKILEFGKELLTLKGQVGTNTSDIKELQKDLKDLTSAVRDLSFSIQRLTDSIDRALFGSLVINYWLCWCYYWCRNLLCE